MTAKEKPHKCPSCGSAMTDHYGLEVTCRKLKEARAALKVIITWATFQRGIALNPRDTENLCKTALAASEP